MANEFIFLSTMFEQNILRELLFKLEEAKILYKIKNKSSLTNYKTPLSTYIEIEIYVHNHCCPVNFKILENLAG
jgi:hypothetical protein